MGIKFQLSKMSKFERSGIEHGAIVHNTVIYT